MNIDISLPVVIFVIQTLALVSVVFLYRTYKVFVTRTPANSWSRSQPGALSEPALIIRCHDAHKNCVEMLPVFLGILWLISLSDSNHMKAAMPFIIGFITLRLVQSGIHVIGTTPLLVIMRGLFFSGQLMILFWLCIQQLLMMASL